MSAEQAASAAAVSAQVDIERWTRGALERTTDLVAEEVPVALVYHDVPHVVMLATPADLEDYAVGFTLSEGLVARAEEIRGVEVSYGALRSEEHTSELQSQSNLVCRLLLEKKKNNSSLSMLLPIYYAVSHELLH